MIRGMEHLSSEGRLRIRIVQPGEEKGLERPYGRLPAPKGSLNKAGEALLIGVRSDRTESNGFKLRVDLNQILGRSSLL